MTQNKVCSYCKKDSHVSGNAVCELNNYGFYSLEKEKFFSLELVSEPIESKGLKVCQPNPEATEYFRSIWGFGGTQNKW